MEQMQGIGFVVVFNSGEFCHHHFFRGVAVPGSEFLQRSNRDTINLETGFSMQPDRSPETGPKLGLKLGGKELHVLKKYPIEFCALPEGFDAIKKPGNSQVISAIQAMHLLGLQFLGTRQLPNAACFDCVD